MLIKNRKPICFIRFFSGPQAIFFFCLLFSLAFFCMSKPAFTFDNGGNAINGRMPLFDLQARLDAKIRHNKGYGGGMFRMESNLQGVLFEGASGFVTCQSLIPMETHYTFEIASTSKAFTATITLILMEDGLIRLDDPIAFYLPTDITSDLLVIEEYNYGPEITIRQLLNHTSGLPDYWYDPPYIVREINAFLAAFYRDKNHFWEPEELIAYAKALDPIGPPGLAFHYSDTGYVLLGLVIEAVTGKELHEIYRQRLFEPLRMEDTYLSYREWPTSPSLESHRYEWRRDMHGKTHQSADWAGGGLVSSSRDLNRFLDALFHGGIFSDVGTLEYMLEWIPTETAGVWYGLGLYRIVLGYGLGELWGHDGYGNAWMYYWPEEGISFVGTLNQALNDWWDLVAAAILNVKFSQ